VDGRIAAALGQHRDFPRVFLVEVMVDVRQGAADELAAEVRGLRRELDQLQSTLNELRRIIRAGVRSTCRCCSTPQLW
jgi:hypothetical protein